MCCSMIIVTQGNFRMIECLKLLRFSRLLDLSDSRPLFVTQVNLVFLVRNVDSLDASELPQTTLE